MSKENEGKEVSQQTASSPAEATFHLAQRQALALSQSEFVPKAYQGTKGVANCLMAQELANRMGMTTLAVMQNLYPIQGKPTWSSTFVIAAINASGRFKGELRFDVKGEGDTLECTAWGISEADGAKLVGPTVTMEMAKAEGWATKAGSKWKTMPTLMVRYRAAAFFGRIYCPDFLAGLHTSDEAQDMRQVREVAPESELQATLDNLVAEDGEESVEAEIVECTHNWTTAEDGTAACSLCGEIA